MPSVFRLVRTWALIGALALVAGITLTPQSTIAAMLAWQAPGKPTGVIVNAPPPVSAPATPNTPSPAASATSVSINPTLSWQASGATTYDVKFGTSNTPPTVSTGQAGASYTPATLANSTTYYWQIVAINAYGSTTGPLWSFTTVASGGGGGCTVTSNGSQSDTQAKITAASSGDTVCLPSGTFAWASGVTVSNPVTVQGSSGGKIEGNSTSSVAIGTGTKAFTTQAGLDWTAGEVVRAIHIRTGDSMTGTVTSYSSTTLTLNITSTSGTGTKNLWVFEQDGATTLQYSGSGVMWDVSKTGAGLIKIGQFDVQRTSGLGRMFQLTGTGTFVAHDMRIANGSPNTTVFYFVSNGGLVQRVDAMTDYNWPSGLGGASQYTGSFVDVQWGALNSTWQSPHSLGTADTNGTGNIYVENNDVIGFGLEGFDCSDNCRLVVRYNRFTHTAFTSHGPDTGTSGLRNLEIYNNVWRFQPDNAGNCDNTLVMDYLLNIRGGLAVITDNEIDDLGGSCLGAKDEIKYQLQAMWRNAGPWACWNGGYPLPHQQGRDYVSGAETTVGNYHWSNTGAGSQTPSLNQYGPNECGASGSGQVLSTYIQSGRDYIVGTARPSYTKYTYPHPLGGS
ncbi:MAG: hypothetical protein H0W42_02990 [Gemmatimonadaceae bacterium]|nr:hypothetical protein [Gemmatimonadaceae bacterium]